MSFCRSFHSWQVRVNIMISNKRLMCDASQAKLQWTQAVYKKGITFAASDYHVLLKINEHSKGPGCWFNSSRHQHSCWLQIRVEEFIPDPEWEEFGTKRERVWRGSRESPAALRGFSCKGKRQQRMGTVGLEHSQQMKCKEEQWSSSCPHCCTDPEWAGELWAPRGEFLVNSALYHSIFIEDEALPSREKSIWKWNIDDLIHLHN